MPKLESWLLGKMAILQQKWKSQEEKLVGWRRGQIYGVGSADGTGGEIQEAAGNTELRLRRETMTWISDLEIIFISVLTKEKELNKFFKGNTVENEK